MKYMWMFVANSSRKNRNIGPKFISASKETLVSRIKRFYQQSLPKKDQGKLIFNNYPINEQPILEEYGDVVGWIKRIPLLED